MDFQTGDEQLSLLQHCGVIIRTLKNTRNRMLITCLKNGTVCRVSDMASLNGLAQADVSLQLSQLKKIGLVIGESRGIKKGYRLDELKWEEIKRCLTGLAGIDPLLE